MFHSVSVGTKYTIKTIFGENEGVLNTYNKNAKTYTLKNGKQKLQAY